MQSYLAPDANAGSVALVTGGGTGIGRAIAEALARLRGVARAVRAAPRAARRGAGRDRGGRRHLLHRDRATCASPSRSTRCSTQSGEATAASTSLVNNAGGQFRADAEAISLKGLRAVHRLAVDAVWDITSKAATRFLIPQRSGVVLFVAFSPRACQLGYAHATAARAGVENLAASLGVEWARYGIRAAALARRPGADAGRGRAVRRGAVAELGARRPARPPRPAGGHRAAGGVPRLAARVAGSRPPRSPVDGGQSAWGSAASRRAEQRPRRISRAAGTPAGSPGR